MALTVTAQDSHMDSGPGLWARTFRMADGSESRPMLTNLRVAGGHKRGSLLINTATVLLFALAIGLYVVSINAQFVYVMAQKHDELVSWVEAASLDGGMAVASILALGLSRAGMSARIERLFVVVCAIGSAVMNLAAADTSNVRSVLAYVGPPLFLAAVVDRTVSVIRRHYLGDEDASAWSNLGRVSLYTLRLAVAFPSTVTGLRRVLLNKTPLPGKPEPVKAIEMLPLPLIGASWPVAGKPRAITPPAPKPPRPRKTTQTRTSGKQSALIKLATDQYGLATLPVEQVSKLATRLAPEVGIHPATARRVLVNHARALQNGGGK